MARSVNVHSIVIEVVTAITKSRYQLQDEIMDVLTAAGHEILSAESTLMRSKRMPDKESESATGLSEESPAIFMRSKRMPDKEDESATGLPEESPATESEGKKPGGR